MRPNIEVKQRNRSTSIPSLLSNKPEPGAYRTSTRRASPSLEPMIGQWTHHFLCSLESIRASRISCHRWGDEITGTMNSLGTLGTLVRGEILFFWTHRSRVRGFPRLCWDSGKLERITAKFHELSCSTSLASLSWRKPDWRVFRPSLDRFHQTQYRYGDHHLAMQLNAGVP